MLEIKAKYLINFSHQPILTMLFHIFYNSRDGQITKLIASFLGKNKIKQEKQYSGDPSPQASNIALAGNAVTPHDNCAGSATENEEFSQSHAHCH